MIVYDWETFAFNWMVVFKELPSGEYKVIVDNVEELKDYITKTITNKIFVGYNNKQFDDIVTAGVFNDTDPYTTATALMATENKYSVYKSLGIKQLPIISADLIQDLLGMSLKQAEGYMNLSVEECSIPFDIDRPLTPEEIEIVLKYCKHDVDSTEVLLNKRQNYVGSKLMLIKMFNLPLTDISKTNSNLCATVLNAERKSHNDELQYDIIPQVKITNPVYKKVLDLYVGHDLDYTKTMTLNICGLEHKLAYGGIHAAKDNFIYEGEMWDSDVTSFYPSMMIKYNFNSRNIKDSSMYKNIYDERVRAKKNKEKAKANALKQIVNTVYGAMKSKFNQLFDPKMANQVCITGQLLLIDLLEKLEPYITLVQSNTDGILYIPHNKEKILEILDEWQTRTGMGMETEKFKKIWQKDVNNYIIVDENDKIKVKGGYVAQYYEPGTNENPQLRNNARILDIATVEYFVHGIKPEDTINNATDIFLFQYITKTGRTYDTTYWQHQGAEVEVNNVNRVYSSKDTTDGTLFKVKRVGNVTRKDSIANLPPHCVVDNGNKLTIDSIDKQWYIDQAYKRIHDFME